MASYSERSGDRDFVDEELLLEPKDWEIGAQSREVEERAKICVCEIPSTQNLIRCSEEECAIKWFHRECAIGIAQGTGIGIGMVEPPSALSWICKDCSKKPPGSGGSDGNSVTSGTRKKSSDDPEKQDRASCSADTPTTKKQKVTHQSNVDSEAVIANGPQLLRKAIQSVHSDVMKNKDVATLAEKIKCDGEPFFKLSREITEDVVACAISGDGLTVGPSAKTEVCKAFHKYRCGSDIKRKWDLFLSEQNVTASDLIKYALLQYVLRKMLQYILATDDHFIEGKDDQHIMTKEEEGVLRLIAGYVPFALVKRYARMRSPLGQKFKSALLKWRVDDDKTTDADTFMEYTSVWLTYQNRGGLFLVNDKLYRVFWAFEYAARKELDVSRLVGRKDSAKQILEQAIHASDRVHMCWEVLVCEDLEDEEAEELFSTLVNYFVLIRLRSFVRLFVILKKKEESALRNKKSGKGLRKGLNQKSQSQK